MKPRDRRKGRRSLASGAAGLVLLTMVWSPAAAVDEPPFQDGRFDRPAAPPLRITEPREGSLVRAPKRITIHFQREAHSLVPASLELWIDGVDYTESLRFWVDRAWLDLPRTFSWTAGEHVLLARQVNTGGGLFEHELRFSLDGGAGAGGPVVYQWPLDYDSPNAVANLMEDYQRFNLNKPAYWHSGLDLRAAAGSPVRPAVGGYIAHKGCYALCYDQQWNVTLVGDDDLIWQYNHLDPDTLINKQVGDRVEQGEMLGEVVTWLSSVNNVLYHHLHVNAAELDGMDVDAWRAQAEDPMDTPAALPEPYGDDFRFHNPLLFLSQAGDLDTVLPDFSGQTDGGAPEILFLPNGANQAIQPNGQGDIVLAGDVDIAAHLSDMRDEIAGIDGYPYWLGLYEVGYSVIPVETDCYKGWVPYTPLAKFDEVPGGYDGDLQSQLLLEVFEPVLDDDGAEYATVFDYDERNFWYNVSNQRWGEIDAAGGYWNTDWSTIQGPVYLDGTYEVTVRAEDFSGNQISLSELVEVSNDYEEGDYCASWIIDLNAPDVEAEPPGGPPIAFAPPPAPLGFGPITGGVARAEVSAADWPAWYFDDRSRGIRVAIGVLDGNHVEVEYVPYLGDVILEIPAEAQTLPLSPGGPPPPFDPSAPSAQPVDLRLSTRLARHPLSGDALLGSPHGYDQVTFELVMAEPIDVMGETWVLGVRDGSPASWRLAPPPSSGPPPIPDGTFGSPFLVTGHDPGGTLLELAWDAASCPAADTNLLYGSLDELGPGVTVDGSVCGMGNTGDATWSGVPPGNLWFVLVSEDGVETEGTWGLDSLGNPRGGTLASGECGNVVRDDGGSCP